MKFTFFAFWCPILILLAEIATGTVTPRRKPMTAGDVILFFWIVGGFLASCVYWLTRVVRRATRDGSHNEYARLNDRR